MQIAVVGASCIFPNANSVDELWNIICKHQQTIKAVTESEISSSLQKIDSGNGDKLGPLFAASLNSDQNILQSAKNLLGPNKDANNRLEQMLCYAYESLLQDHKLQLLPKSSMVLGSMSQDAHVRYNVLLDYLERKGHESITSSDLRKLVELAQKNKVKRTQPIDSCKIISRAIGLTNEPVVVDAACASSLAALEIACNKLVNHVDDLVICAGVDNNLGPESFLLFSKLGALAPKPCKPFDDKIEGMTQGEGCGMVALMRYDDALSEKRKILGIINAIGSSSDGNETALFEPSAAGQIRAYTNAYKKLDKDKVIYIETHGTGTQRGDDIELESISEFFPDGTSIGATKYNFGHTKGAAGILSLIKVLCMLQNKIDPGQGYTLSSSVPQSITLNEQKRKLSIAKDTLIGINGFGFGGINYHLVVGSSSQAIQENNKIITVEETSVIAELPEEQRLFYQTFLNIPPKKIQNIADDQLAVACLGIKLEEQQRAGMIPKKATVVYNGKIGSAMLDKLMVLFLLKDYFIKEGKVSLAKKLSKSILSQINEEIGPGCLSNCIPARAIKRANSYAASLTISTYEVIPRYVFSSSIIVSKSKKNFGGVFYA